MPTTIALIAHDGKKDDMVALVRRYQDVLQRYHLVATGTTGQRIRGNTDLTVETLLSGPLGGDAQISAQVASQAILAVIFLIDPLYAQPHEPDVNALLRICNVHNVPLATNIATAEALLNQFARQRVAHLIFNPTAGQGNPQQQLSLIREILEPRLHLAVHCTTPTMDAVTLAQAAIAADADMLIASGGDGTVSAVASTLVNTHIPLGILPRGTANALAAVLNIPADLRAACEIILTGLTAIIDTAQCNGQTMTLLAGIGYEAGMVERADGDLKARFGVLGYIFAGIQQLNEQELFDTQIEINGEVRSFQSGAVTVANAAPPTSVLAQGLGQVIVNDGLLDVTISTAQTKLQSLNTLLNLFGSALVRTVPEREDMVALRASQIRIETTPPQKVVLDGEIIGTTPVEIICQPRSLVVVVPELPPLVKEKAPSDLLEADDSQDEELT
ncbi:methylglyoxal synthase [Sphaerothrix gracilis]|uniref:methylglyoxal synthase n=1 Tax=Sphaerothrix gracilis TaxID=3151835 RepID=UPI0031FD8CFE